MHHTEVGSIAPVNSRLARARRGLKGCETEDLTCGVSFGFVAPVHRMRQYRSRDIATAEEFPAHERGAFRTVPHSPWPTSSEYPG